MSVITDHTRTFNIRRTHVQKYAVKEWNLKLRQLRMADGYRIACLIDAPSIFVSCGLETSMF